ncbi:MAG: flagellar assembly peptidoglycan hydrolase FlgJ [Thiogranum sp.]|nr:flagellar assembly peptidoglycan hydrolase FlgJ [Thiogranum sp.]
MTASLSKTDVYTDFQGLSALRTQARGGREETLREVAGQFEALFIQMMLKSMRDASLGEGLLDNDQTQTYQAMFDKQIAIDMSSGRGIGLSEMIVRQLGGAGIETRAADARQASPNDIPQARAQQSLSTVPVADEKSVKPAVGWKPDTPEAFVTHLWPHAKRTADQLGVKPEALLAQAALETGWGRHMIIGSDGRNSNNLFGIKADSRWKGGRVATETIEYRDGLVRKERAHFRAYASVAESFSDYAEFLTGNPRYRKALDSGADAREFTRALAAAGYATDPEYSAKIDQIMGSNRFRDALGEIKEPGLAPLS